MKLVIAWLLGVPLGVAATGALLSVRLADVLGPPQHVEAPPPGASSPTTLQRVSRQDGADVAVPERSARRGGI